MGTWINVNGGGPGVNVSGATVTLQSTPTFATAFMIASNQAFIARVSMTWNGGGNAVTRYTISGNAVISAAGSTDWPSGLTGGTTGTGGQIT